MSYILGIDEAGRGAWAGPLVVGAVILGDYKFKGLADSKLLLRSQREKQADIIKSYSLATGLGWVTPAEIDRLGLSKATSLGMERAIRDIKHLTAEIIIDGHINYLPGYENTRCVIKADQTIPSVSAASIIAKVARDDYMRELSTRFPDYGFDTHVGYGTKKHLSSMLKHGLLDIHRRSFKPVAAIV